MIRKPQGLKLKMVSVAPVGYPQNQARITTPHKATEDRFELRRAHYRAMEEAVRRGHNVAEANNNVLPSTAGFALIEKRRFIGMAEGSEVLSILAESIGQGTMGVCPRSGHTFYTVPKGVVIRFPSWSVTDWAHEGCPLKPSLRGILSNPNVNLLTGECPFGACLESEDNTDGLRLDDELLFKLPTLDDGVEPSYNVVSVKISANGYFHWRPGRWLKVDRKDLEFKNQLVCIAR